MSKKYLSLYFLIFVSSVLQVRAEETPKSSHSFSDCPNIKLALELKGKFGATLSAKGALPHKPLLPEQLPSIANIDDAIRNSIGCEKQVLFEPANIFLKSVKIYIDDYDSNMLFNGIPIPKELREAALEADNRTKLVFLDAGINAYMIPFFPQLQMSTNDIKKISMIGDLTSGVMWDIGDVDDNPTTTKSMSHGTEVMITFGSTYKKQVADSNLPLTPALVPLIYPIKIWNFYSLTNYKSKGAFWMSDPEWTKMDTERRVSLVEKVQPRIINFSGAFDFEDRDRFEVLRKYLAQHPEVILVCAAGNQMKDLDSSDFERPWPSKFTDDESKRLPNIVNISSFSGESLTGNWGSKFVDVAFEASSTSFAAPQASAILAFALHSFPDCFKSQSPSLFLKALSGGAKTEHDVLRIDLNSTSIEQIKNACAIKKSL